MYVDIDDLNGMVQPYEIRVEPWARDLDHEPMSIAVHLVPEVYPVGFNLDVSEVYIRDASGEAQKSSLSDVIHEYGDSNLAEWYGVAQVFALPDASGSEIRVVFEHDYDGPINVSHVTHEGFEQVV